MTDPILRAALRTVGPKRKILLAKYKTRQARNAIVNCTKCPLHKTRTNAVPWVGRPGSPIALIGEAPGANEDRRGEPFVGRAGRLLNDCLVSAGMSRQDVFMMNVLCCRPPQNRNPEPHEAAACRPHFERQLEISGAWVVVVAGNAALYSTLTLSGISHWRGRVIWQNGRLWAPIKHPAYYLRNSGSTAELVGDLHQVHRIVEGYRKVEVDLKDRPTVIEGQRREIVEAINEQGWAFFWSEILEDRIAVVSETVLNRKKKRRKPPQAITELPTYTVDELVRIGMMGKGRMVKVEDLRRIHAAKKVLNGTIVK